LSWNWFAKLKNIKFSIVILILQAFLLVNAPLFVKEASVQNYRFLIMTYMALLIGFEAFVEEGAFKDQPIGNGLLWFGIGLVGTTLIFTSGGYISRTVEVFQAFTMSKDAPLMLLITQGVVVASVEEKVFRDYLVQALGIIPSQLAFGVFHAAAYGLALQSIAIAVIAGFVFYILAKYTSLWTAVGAHAAFNLYALGVI